MKRFIAILAALLIGAFSGTGYAIHWEGRAGQEDRDWFTPENWSEYAVPTSSDDTLTLLVPGYGPVLSSSGAIANKLHISLWDWDGELTVTDTGSLDITYEATIGHGTGETGILNNSGSISTGAQMAVGIDGGAVLNMYGGQINVSGDLQVAKETGQGYVNLRDGMTVASGLDVNTNGNAMINISAGELLIANINPSLINSLISGGHITAYGGWGTVLYDINQSHPGYTTLYATDGTPTAGYISWDSGGIGNSWDMPTNWNLNKTPRDVHDVLLTSDTASGSNCPVIPEGMNATAHTIVIGDGTSPDTPKLKMTGGNLDTTFTIYVGHQTKGSFNISGGNIDTDSGSIISGHFGGNGRIDILGGNITTASLLIGHEAGSDSLVKMTGGSLSCNSISIGLLTGIGRLELYGGTITATSLSIDSLTSSMNITEGTLILDGDKTSSIASYISSGVLTGYDDPININYDYGITNSGKTTVTATAGKPCSESDLNGDCLVDLDDGAIFAGQWLNTGGCSAYDCADIDKNLSVNTIDFTFLAREWLDSPALPRIAAQANVPEPKFYNTETEETFVPIGSNYIPLDWVDGIPYHTTFNTGHYDADAAEEALSEMEIDGYNVVRVFVDKGDPVHEPLGEYGMAGPYNTYTADLYQPCVDNFIDFLRRARSHNIYVIPCLYMWPHSYYYNNLVHSNVPTNVENVNIIILAQGGIDAKKIYLSKLVEAVENAEPNGALLSTVFAWELSNEIGLSNDIKPFSMTVGIVTPADGITYDMTDAGQRQQCMDSNIINWTNQCVTAVKQVDPSAMVSVSVFSFDAVGHAGPNGLLPLDVADHRFPARPWSLLEFSTLDYVDFHTYPQGNGYLLLTDLESSEYSIWDLNAKPIVMGEFGAFKHYYSDIYDAAEAMVTHRQQARDFGFEGELFWTWQENGQYQLWHMLEAGEVINDALKPIQ